MKSCEQVKQRADEMTHRWELLFNRVKQYLHAGDILRHRKIYRQGVEKLESWIIEANQLLSAVPVANLQVLQIVTDILFIVIITIVIIIYY